MFEPPRRTAGTTGKPANFAAARGRSRTHQARNTPIRAAGACTIEIARAQIRELFRRRHAPTKQAGRRRTRSMPGNLHGRAVSNPAGRRSLRPRDVGSVRRRGWGSHPASRDGRAMSVLIRPELREPPMPFNRPRNPPSRRTVRPTLAERATRHLTGRPVFQDVSERKSPATP